jgi:hypothetical protein
MPDAFANAAAHESAATRLAESVEQHPPPPTAEVRAALAQVHALLAISGRLADIQASLADLGGTSRAGDAE